MYLGPQGVALLADNAGKTKLDAKTLLITHQYLPFKNPITVTFNVNYIFFANVVIDLARDTSALYSMARCRYHVSAKTKTTPFEVQKYSNWMSIQSFCRLCYP